MYQHHVQWSMKDEHVPLLNLLPASRTVGGEGFSSCLELSLICCLRDRSDGYLKETKDVAKEEGKECSLLLSLSWGAFSWELQRYQEILAGGWGAGLSSHPQDQR